MKKVLRFLMKILLALVGLLVAYAVIGTGLSLITINGETTPGSDVVVYLDNNGVHTDIVVPTKTDRIDWSTVVKPNDTSAKIAKTYLAFGWGSQDFYLNVPEWKDLTLGIAAKAISGAGGSALHACYVHEPVSDRRSRRLVLSTSQYDALVRYILSSAEHCEDGSFARIDHAGYGPSDAFYVGIGHYSPFFTCNTWANSALKTCGQKCCLWTALQQPIFWKYEQRN